jgi:hypothetical protein
MMTPGQVRDMIAYINERRHSSAPFDIVHAGITSGKDLTRDAGIVAEYAGVGVTWWVEAINPERWEIGETGLWKLCTSVYLMDHRKFKRASIDKRQ